MCFSTSTTVRNMLVVGVVGEYEIEKTVERVLRSISVDCNMQS